MWRTGIREWDNGAIPFAILVCVLLIAGFTLAVYF
jgi:hypothetical protein